MKLLTVIILFITLQASSKTGEPKYPPKNNYITSKIETQAPVIDGVLDDKVWGIVEWGDSFTQSIPNEGEAPSQKTSFKILYDDDNIYVGVRAYDTEADKIEKRMSRRDAMDGDWVDIKIDSYFDHRSAFSFMLNASGVKGDRTIFDDGQNIDYNWDPVWYGKATVDDQGWTAEYKIPLSQLRFGDKQNHIWGLQITRWLFRKEEASTWQFIPQDAPGLVHYFGELHGIEGIKPKKNFEILPYTVGNYEHYEKEEGNPFATGSDAGFGAGIDGKIGVTSDMTVDFTVNPDFGQVEADPSQVNLTEFETYFEEKRPFFIEGKSITSLQLTMGDSPISRDNLFYSRRIGRNPHYYPELEDGEYTSVPDNTSIISAVKLTGKTKNGVSIGVLESVTAKEMAEIDLEGARRTQVVEPLTNYFVGRLKKDYNKGNTILGGMFTSTNRDINDPALDFLHTSAYTGGLDFMHQWKDRTYYLMVNTAFSHVIGSESAILGTQLSPQRYFQRPDAKHVSVDSSRTSLSGHGGTVTFGRSGNGHINYVAWVTWRSPGFELNDVGFLYRADDIMQIAWAQYRIWKPFSIFRSMNINVNQWSGWNFGGINTYNGGNTNFNMEFKNYWSLGSGINAELSGVSIYALRGGPALRYPTSGSIWYYVSSDSRKKLIMTAGGNNHKGADNSSVFQNYYISATYRPVNALSVSAMPSVSMNEQELQYVSTCEYGYENRYLFANIDQTTLSLTLRLNLSITPELSIQYYGQPFISAGDYSGFKRITDPKADEYNDRFVYFDENSQISYDQDEQMYYIDENSDGTTDYDFYDPDFNFKQFRSNLVIRWEYTRGSTLYLVWSQGRTGYDTTGNNSFHNDVQGLFDIFPHNVFLIKLNYWISV